MTEIAVRFEGEKSNRYYLGEHWLMPVANLLPQVYVNANGTLRRAPLPKRTAVAVTLDRVFNAYVRLEGPPCPLAEAAERVCQAIREAHAAQGGTPGAAP